MKSPTRGQLKAGMQSMRNSKMRNFWTMLGVIIGVSSVITIVGIGEGIKQQISGRINHMGKNLLTIRPAALGAQDGINTFSGVSVSSRLTQTDALLVAKNHDVMTSAPLTAMPGRAMGVDGKHSNGLIIGTTPDLPSLLNQPIAYGVFLTDDDNDSHVAVLGQTAADKLFDEDVPLGRSFELAGQQFVVRGIFDAFDSTPLSQEVDFNNAIFIPNNVAEKLTNNTATTYEILVRPNKQSDAPHLAKSLEQSIDKAHGGENVVDVLQPNQSLRASNEVLDLLTRLIAGVAAISLVVGGIGIMNVMLVSVAERMHEIGVRKAIGATNRQIMMQFMIESTMLSLAGGVIGIALAYFIDLILHLTTDLQPIISWQVVVLASCVSLIVGVLFGTVPAIKAARKHPIEALRSD